MPAPATHYIFAKSVEDKVASLESNLSFSKAAFYYGTQGPDFLFSHKVWRMAWNGENLVEIGSLLHHACPSKIFSLMKEYLENEPCDRDLIKSYIYGFLAHYALDRKTHPLIFAVQKAFTEENNMGDYRPIVVHNIIELNIDALLVRSELGFERAIDFRLHEVLDKNPYLIDEMAKLMEYVVPKIVFCDASKDDFADAFNNMRMGQKALGDRTGKRRKLIQLLEKPIKKLLGGPLLSSLMRQPECDNDRDYLNITHKEWALVFDSRVRSSKSFIDLYREAQDDVLGLIEAFGKENCEEAIKEYSGDISFDTGVRYDIKEPIA